MAPARAGSKPASLDSVSAIRTVLYNGKQIRQRLLALSDVGRSQTYEFAGEAPMSARRYRVTPVVEGNRGGLLSIAKPKAATIWWGFSVMGSLNGSGRCGDT
jgi:hypothetical protein